MSYLDLLKLASPEAIIAVTALAVLGIGLASTRASGICSFAATLGLALAIGAVIILPQQATLLHGMLVITPGGMVASVALTMTDEYPYAFAQVIISAIPAT